MTPLKIALLSDPHREVEYQQEALDFLLSKGAEYIIHAGDLVCVANLEMLKKTGLPYICVFGNNDYSLAHLSNEYRIKKEPYCFKIKETTFKLMHLPYYLNNDTDVVIFGHTHQFETDYKGDTLFINPGEICAREKPKSECVFLEINENEYIINYYSRKINEKSFESKEIRYERK